jgi:signal transduction histidine kinase
MATLTRGPVEELAGAYAAALREYNATGSEAALLQAYQLGRAAVSVGVGVLEMAALHQEALAQALRHAPSEAVACVDARANEFLAEALAPFELSRRGFQQISVTLQDVARGLQDRLDAALRAFQSAQGELEERRRVEQIKNEFICMISHEVRTPLTSIHGALNLLTAGLGGELNEQGRQLLDVAYRNSRRLVRLVTDILDLQRIESGSMTFNMRPIEVRPFLEQALEVSRGYAAQYSVQLVLGPLPRKAWVRADVDRLMQVMDNLLSNAAKFSPAEGTVTVAVTRHDGCVRVAVQDQGPGVPEDFRSRIFERFSQADPTGTRPGVGLGLSISKAIVEQLGGRLDFANATGGGAVFFVELPEWDPKRGLSREAAACRSEA